MKTERLSLKILALLLFLLTLFSLASCGQDTPVSTVPQTAEVTTAAKTTGAPNYTVRLNAPASTEIHTELQANYLADRDVFSVLSYADKKGTEELGHPVPITLTWDIETTLSESNVRAFFLRIWRESAPEKAVVQATLSKSTKKYDLSNAMIGETYCWTVSALDGDGNLYESAAARFTTAAQAPRNLQVDSITNVRDVGGWPTEDGGRVRQGLLYRGSKLAANKTASILISEEGVKTMRDELGIKTEIDLRLKEKLGGLSASPLGETVAFYSRPMDDDYNTMLTDDAARKNIRDVFSLLADESNYPIYIHCSIGTDRTGLISWLINGLCGVSEENLWRDFLFSNFGVINGTRKDGFSKVVSPMKKATGATYTAQIYNYLKDTVGIPEADLNAVIRIMKGPAAN